MIKSTLAAAVLVAAGFAGAADAAQKTTTFQVKITIDNSCSIGAASNVDFGNKPRGTAADTQAQGTLVVNCTVGTTYSIGLDKGLAPGATVTTRQMANGSELIAYSLFKDSARTENWGDTGTDTFGGTGTGQDESIPVFGKVDGDGNVPAGVYTDTITATITY